MRIVKSISRDTVIRALRHEPLKRGEWVAKGDLRARGNCTVCAVGSVLREVGLPNYMINHAAWQNTHHVVPDSVRYVEEEVVEALKQRDYLGALSLKFEGSRGSIKKIRRELIELVKKNFPKRILLNIPLEVPNAQEIAKAAREYAHNAS